MRLAAGLRPLLLALFAPVAATTAAPADPPEIRALWVDAFGPGIRTVEEAEELVVEAKRANLNLLFVQVRRRGDALYTRGTEPPLDVPAYDAEFDALENVIRAAHREGLQVHAWVNAMPVWRNEPPPCDARHLFNRHGSGAEGREMWMTTAPDGATLFPVGTFLDPGHPEAQEYLAAVYAKLVREYDLDGIHFDYIRYPETEPGLGRGSAVGYNPTALARFRRSTGRTGTPDPGDEAWMAWRRRQVSDVVRRVFLEAKALKPKIVVSASVVPWGAPPADERDFAETAPMQRAFQDWRSWLEEGILDLAVPMNYASDSDGRARPWLDGWIAWERHHQGSRGIVVGLAGYKNAPDSTLAQIGRVRRADGGRRLAGISLFSYRVPVLDSEPPSPTAPPALPGERLLFLSAGTRDSPGAFAAPAPFPRLPWIEAPTHGFVAGVVSAETREGADDVEVEIRRTGLFRRTLRVRTDANGFFGAARLASGRYRVRLATSHHPATAAFVEVVPGDVARVSLRSLPLALRTAGQR